MTKHLDLAPSVVETLTSAAVMDGLAEYAEVGIDTALSEGLTLSNALEPAVRLDRMRASAQRERSEFSVHQNS